LVEWSMVVLQCSMLELRAGDMLKTWQIDLVINPQISWVTSWVSFC